VSITHNAARTAGRDNYDTPAAYLRSTPDEVATFSTTGRPDCPLRLTFRCGHSVVFEASAMRWLLKHDLKDAGDDFLHALAALSARRLFRSFGGKKWLRCTLQEWVSGPVYSDYLAQRP
jgi:hypothetical protein